MSPQYGSHHDRVPTLEPGAPWASERPYSHVVLLGYTLFAQLLRSVARVQIGPLVVSVNGSWRGSSSEVWRGGSSEAVTEMDRFRTIPCAPHRGRGSCGYDRLDGGD